MSSPLDDSIEQYENNNIRNFNELTLKEIPILPIGLLEGQSIFEDHDSLFDLPAISSSEANDIKIIRNNFENTLSSLLQSEEALSRYETELCVSEERCRYYKLGMEEREYTIDRLTKQKNALERDIVHKDVELKGLKKKLDTFVNEKASWGETMKKQGGLVKKLLQSIEQKKDSEKKFNGKIEELSTLVKNRESQLHESLKNCFELQKRLSKSEELRNSVSSPISTPSARTTPRGKETLASLRAQLKQSTDSESFLRAEVDKLRRTERELRIQIQNK